MKPRKTAGELVQSSIPSNIKRKTWLETLSQEDQAYVRAVVCYMKCTPGVAPYLVADAIIAELHLATSRNTIAKTLKDMLNATKKS
jgi:hypothetical protein